MKHPLDVLVIGMHEHGPQYDTTDARKYLREHSYVRSFGSTESFNEARTIINRGLINTIFMSPWMDHRIDKIDDEDVISFILDQRRTNPDLVFVLYSNQEMRKELIGKLPKIEHYFVIDPEWLKESNKKGIKKSDDILDKCQKSHLEYYNHDIAISFAREQRDEAEKIAEQLKSLKNRVFIDKDFQHEIAASDIPDYLQRKFSTEARYCGVILSKSYDERQWTRYERKIIVERGVRQIKDYIIPIIFDGTKIPGILDDVGYFLLESGIDHIASTIHKKLWHVPRPADKCIIGKEAPEYEPEYIGNRQ